MIGANVRCEDDQEGHNSARSVGQAEAVPLAAIGTESVDSGEVAQIAEDDDYGAEAVTRLRGSAGTGLSTNEILAFTRD